MFSWILGGNSFVLEGCVLYCSFEDKVDLNLKKWFWNDDVLERVINVDWYFVLVLERMLIDGDVIESGRFLLCLCWEDFKLIIVGCELCEIEFGEFWVVMEFEVVLQYVKFVFKDGVLFVMDLDSKIGMWIMSISGGCCKLILKMFI